MTLTKNQQNYPYWIPNDHGIDGTPYSLSVFLPNNVFESIGPTGSGATNIWPVLDSLPSYVRYVDLQLELFFSNSSIPHVYDMKFYGKKFGASSSILQGEWIVDLPRANVGQLLVPTVRVVTDENQKFTVAYNNVNTTSTSTVAIYLLGAGYYER